MTRRKLSLTLALGSAMAIAPAAVEAAILVQDDFNRTNSNTLGATSDGNDTWFELEGNNAENTRDDRVILDNNQAQFQHWTGYNNPGMSLSTLRLTDGIIEADINVTSSSDARRYGINYRAGTPFYAAYFASANTFHVLVTGTWSGAEDIELKYGETLLATGNISDVAQVTDNPFSLRVEFNGSSHQVYVDDALVIDYTDPLNRNDGGAVGVGGYYARMRVDNFTVSQIPEPASLALIGLGGLMMIGRGRRD